MSTSVHIDVPGSGSFRVSCASRTAGDLISSSRAHLPNDCPWHGNKLLSCGLRQFQDDDIIAAGSTLVFANYSEICNEET